MSHFQPPSQMVTSAWTATVAGTPREVLAYLSDYSNLPQWHGSHIVGATRLTGPPEQLGTAVETTCAMQVAGCKDVRHTIKWKLKQRDQNRASLKGSLKLRFWFWPATVKIKLIDNYYVTAGPSEESSVVEYNGRVHGKGMGVLFTPLVKDHWRRLSEDARNGLMRRMPTAGGREKAKVGPARAAVVE